MHLCVVFHDQLAAAPVGDADADTRVFHRAGNADGLAQFHGLVVIRLDRLQRLDKARFRADDLAVRQLLPGPDGVAVADFPRGDADLIGHFVQKRLGGEARLRDAEAAERARGRVVGIVGRAFDLEILIVIGAGCVRTRTLKHRAAQRGERAGVGIDLGLDALNDAVFVAAHGEVHPERVALGMDEQGFGPRELDLDGPAGQVRDERGMVLDAHVFFSAEAAADELILHADLVRAEQELALVQRRVRGLVGRKHHHIAIRVDVRDGAFRLQKRVLRPRRLEMLRNDVFGVFDGRIRVAARDMLIRLHVRFFLVKYTRRVLRPRLGRVMDGRQRLVGHLDELFRLFQNLRRFRDHECDRVAQIMRQPADGDERILVVLQMADLVFAGDICRRNDAHDAGQRLGLRRIDGKNTGTRILAADGGAVAHIGQVPVVWILAVAQHLFLHVDAVDARAELPVVFRRFGDHALAAAFRCQTHSAHDLHIARAAAVIVAQGIADLIVCRVQVPVEQRLCAQHHTRNTEAALHGSGLAVGVGVEPLFFIRQTLDGDDVTARQRIGERCAGADGFAVNEHGARAAGALRTAVLDACQVQRVAQIAQQALILLHRDFRSVYKKYGHGKKLPSFESRLSRHSRSCSRHMATVIPKFPGHGT